MATRVIPQRILKNLRYNTTTKQLNSAHTSLTPAGAGAGETVTPPTTLPPSTAAVTPPPAATLDLDDAERLFSMVPTSTLIRSTAVLHATAVGPVVDLGMWTMKSRLFQKGLPRDALMALTRRTFYEHFCAGEDAAAAGRSIRSLNEAGLRGMLVYGVEDAHDNAGCDRNHNGFLHTVDVSRSLPFSSVSFFSLSFNNNNNNCFCFIITFTINSSRSLIISYKKTVHDECCLQLQFSVFFF